MGGNNPYRVPGQTRARLMKEYLFSDICAYLVILMAGGLKPEFYICTRIF